MASFKIEKNVPMPVTSGRGPSVEYPFLEMEVGDSIFVPHIDAKKASGQISYWKKNHNMNFAIRAMSGYIVNQDGETEAVDGVRIWLKDPADRSNRGRKAANSPTDAPADDLANMDEAALEAATAPDKGKSGKKDKRSTAAPAAEETEY